MKKYFTSKLANVLLYGIKNSDIKDVTRRCAEDIYIVMQNHEGADFKIAFQVADAVIKKNAEQENITRKIGDLEDSANYWSERTEHYRTEIMKMQKTINDLNEYIKSKDIMKTLHEFADTTGIVPVEDDIIEDDLNLGDLDLADANDDVLVRDSDGPLLIEGRQYYVGKVDGTKMADGNMSHRIQIGGIRGKDVFGYYVDDDGIVIDQIVHLDDAPGRYIFCRSDEMTAEEILRREG